MVTRARLTAWALAATLQLALAPGAGAAGAAGDGIVFLGTIEDQFRKNIFPECMASAMHSISPSTPVVAPDAFRDAVFPWFEPGTAPSSVAELTAVLEKPLVRQRVDASGVRYVAVVLGTTRAGNYAGPFLCAAGLGGGGCLGVTVAETSAEVRIALWDLASPAVARELQGSGKGHNILIGLGIPVPIRVDSRGHACTEAARKLMDVISNPRNAAAD